MIQHKVHNDPDAVLFCLIDQLIHVLQCSEHRVDILVVGYVITVVILRRLIDRRQPDRIYAQSFQIIEPRYDPLQVSYPVAVAVLKAAGIYLIYYCLVPPFFDHTTHLSTSCFVNCNVLLQLNISAWFRPAVSR